MEGGGIHMVNVYKLRGKIVEKALTIEELAKMIGADKSTIYRKLKGSGDNFSIKEADLIVKALELTREEATAIFFSQFIA